MFRRWRRIDQPGLELAQIDSRSTASPSSSTLVDGGDAPFSLRYIWTLDTDWRTRKLRIEHMNGDDRWLTIERAGPAAWRIDNRPAPHLDGCAELDLSATPFCNTLAIRRLGGDGELTPPTSPPTTSPSRPRASATKRSTTAPGATPTSASPTASPPPSASTATDSSNATRDCSRRSRSAPRAC